MTSGGKLVLRYTLSVSSPTTVPGRVRIYRYALLVWNQTIISTFTPTSHSNTSQPHNKLYTQLQLPANNHQSNQSTCLSPSSPPRPSSLPSPSPYSAPRSPTISQLHLPNGLPRSTRLSAKSPPRSTPTSSRSGSSPTRRPGGHSSTLVSPPSPATTTPSLLMTALPLPASC